MPFLSHYICHPFFFYVHNILFSVWKLVIMVIIVSAHKVSQILWWQGKRYNNPVTACYGGGGMPGDVGVFTRIMTWPTQCMPEGVHSLHTHLGKHRHAYQLWSSWTTTRKLTSNGSFIRRHLIWRVFIMLRKMCLCDKYGVQLSIKTGSKVVSCFWFNKICLPTPLECTLTQWNWNKAKKQRYDLRPCWNSVFELWQWEQKVSGTWS